MAVRDINPKRSVQKNKPASGRRGSVKNASVSPVKAVPKAKKAVYKKVRRGPKRSSKILQLFASDRPQGELDYTFLLLVGVLAAFGLIMLLSASTPTADVKFGKSYYFFMHQFAYVAAGAVIMMVLSYIDYRKYKPYARLFMIICLVLLALVFFPGIGVMHNGSRRWINLGVTEIQPSEFAKLAVSMFFASLFSYYSSISKKKILATESFWVNRLFLPILLPNCKKSNLLCKK